MNRKHKAQRTNDCDHAGKQLREALQKTVGDYVDIVDQRIHKISQLRFVQRC